MVMCLEQVAAAMKNVISGLMTEEAEQKKDMPGRLLQWPLIIAIITTILFLFPFLRLPHLLLNC